MTREEWEAYDAASVRMQDQRGMVTAATRIGLQQGHQQGWLQRTFEIARSMRREGLDLNLIAKLTGLSAGEIEKLEKAN